MEEGRDVRRVFQTTYPKGTSVQGPGKEKESDGGAITGGLWDGGVGGGTGKTRGIRQTEKN